MRDWVTNVADTHYILGSALGSHPFPMMVRDFHRVIGLEARAQILEQDGRCRICLVACVGGGSNAIGFFHPFLDDRDVRLIGVEAGGEAIITRAARGAVCRRQSRRAAGHPDLRSGGRRREDRADPFDFSRVSTTRRSDPSTRGCEELGRVEYTYATDAEALDAFQTLARLEGILPALESAHAVAYAQRIAKALGPQAILLVNLSGRGDKDVNTRGEGVGARKTAHHEVTQAYEGHEDGFVQSTFVSSCDFEPS